MNYIVFDLEFNMFFKFKEGECPNPALKSEIIQIGAVKLNERLETIGEFNSIIRPVIYKRINPYVKKKINLSSGMVVKGKSFGEAIKSFSTWLGEDSVLCSWGHDDMLGLRDNCLFFGVDLMPFDKYINIQKIFMKHESLTKQPSLESAVESLKIEKSFPFHDALSDAFYTAEVFKGVFELSRNMIINWERVQRENEEKVRELKSFLDKESMFCPVCKRTLEKTREVTKGKKYFAQGYCDNCKLPIRHTSRITQSVEGDYGILSKNSVYKTEEASE